MYGLKENSRVHQLRSSQTKIGRHTSNSIVLRSNLKVSRYHAVIRLIDNKPYIRDIKTEWGTYIGNHRILPDREIELKVGDVLGVGLPATDDPSCSLEVVFIEAEPQQNDSRPDFDNIATQVCDTTNGTNNRSIETIDITDNVESEVIEIPDEENRSNGSAVKIIPRIPSPSLLDGTNPVTSSTGAQIPEAYDVTPDNDINVFTQQNDVKQSILKTTKTSKPSKKQICFVISDEEDESLPDEPNDVKDDSTVNTVIRSVVNERSNVAENNLLVDRQTRPIIEQNRLVDVSPTMNGLLRLKPIQEGFDTPVAGSPISTSNILQSNMNLNSSSTSPIVIIKPEPGFLGSETVNLLNYSMPDEIISLDSDEEDFPCSQLNTTAVADAADYSTTFNLLYEIKNELQGYEEEDVKYGTEWFEPFSQTALAEDLRVESSKQYRQTETAEVRSSDVIDASQESFDSNRKESDTSEPIIKQKLQKIPKVRSPKIPIIEAPHAKRHKRRSAQPEPPSTKKLRGESESEAIFHKLKAKELKSLKSPKKHETRSSVSAAKLKEQRKQKLKEIAHPSTEQESRGSRTSIDVTKIKKTTQNRGSFLTEELPVPSAVQKTRKDKNDKKPDESLSNVSATRSEQNVEPLSSTSRGSLKSIQSDEIVTSSKHSEVSGLMQLKDIPLDEVPQMVEKEHKSRKTRKKSPRPSSHSETSKQIQEIPKKSILKDSKFRYENGDQRLKNRSIQFSDQNKEYFVDKWIKANGGFFSFYKKFEALIKDSQNEFESALATVCSWNVKWLQEQQNQISPPPLYQPEITNRNLIEKYKSDLKFFLFHTLWKAIFNAWNVPEQDLLPHTQFVPENNFIKILHVDTGRPDKSTASKSLWTIVARRELQLNAPVDINNGMLVILSFYVKKVGVDHRIKTMAFAYIASCSRVTEGDKSVDKIIFKIFGKPFTIETDVAKMKILTYTKIHLRQFQALSMTETSPIINALCLADFHDDLDTTLNPNQQFKDKFLDQQQKQAVATFLHSISKESSVCLVNGSSGTGKTQVIVSFLNEVFSIKKRNMLPDDFKVLIITYCDKDADDLLYRIETMNKKENRIMNILRFGNSATIHQNILNCSIEKQVEDLLLNNKNIIDFEEEKNNLKARINSFKLVLESRSAPEIKRKEAQNKLESLEKELEDMGKVEENSKAISLMKSQIAKENVIAGADVIVTTLNSCWSSNFENMFIPTGFNRGDVQKFNTCIFDDANLFHEAALLIPQVLQVPHLFLVGDQQIRRYPNSPYHRLLHNFSTYNKDFLINLDLQHRMLPGVYEWVQNFYKLGMKPSANRKSNLKPFVVIDFNNNVGDDNPFGNQVQLCERILSTLGLPEYNETVRVGVIVASNDEKEAMKKAIPPNSPRRIIIEHLDGFSAREQDVVVTFLPVMVFPEWLYIAVTRPKLSLIICGDFEEIKQSDQIKSLLSEANEKNVYVSIRTNPAFTSVEELKRILTI